MRLDRARPRRAQDDRAPAADPRRCHLAAESSGERCFNDDDCDLDANARSTVALAAWTREQRISMLVYASPMGVYGDVLSHPVDERAPARPISFSADPSSRLSTRSGSDRMSGRSRCARSRSTVRGRILTRCAKAWSPPSWRWPCADSRSRSGARSIECGLRLYRRLHRRVAAGAGQPRGCRAVQCGHRGRQLLIACYVVDRMRDPAAELGQWRKLLRPGGRLAIEVPNTDDAFVRYWAVDAFDRFYCIP